VKIAFVVNTFPVVSETFVVRQIEGMRCRGHEVEVLTGRSDPEARQFFDLDVTVRQIRDGARPRMLSTQLARYITRSLLSPRGRLQLQTAGEAILAHNHASAADIAVRRGEPLGRYDAIIAHFGPGGVRATALQQAGLLEGPIATVFHGYDMSDGTILEQFKPLYRSVFERNAALLPISHFWERRLIEWGAPAERVRVLRMGVDLDDLPRLPLDAPVGAPLRVLSVARLVEKKGLRYAIEGVTRAKSAIEFSIIGSGPLEPALSRMAQGSANPVQMLGRQPHDVVITSLARSDVFLLPSVTAESGDMEGVPVSLMEAMASGVIVVATRHSGIPELIEDGVNGLLVDERDSEAIARALDRIASGELDLHRIRTNARRTVQERFNNSLLDLELESICRSMASGEPMTARSLPPPATHARPFDLQAGRVPAR
jgi:colanic acid/amylovoran biosynthesis glycosyltransferase